MKTTNPSRRFGSLFDLNSGGYLRPATEEEHDESHDDEAGETGAIVAIVDGQEIAAWVEVLS